MPLPQQGHLLVVTATRSLESLAPLIELNQVPWEERTAQIQLSQVMGAALQGPDGRMPLGLEPITIGRASTNQLVLRDPLFPHDLPSKGTHPLEHLLFLHPA